MAWAEFVPLAFNDCLGWVRITVPQPGARAACLSVTAHIHLMQPRIPLRELDAQTESAIRALEDGADTVTVVNELHRVDRIGVHTPATRRRVDTAVRPRGRGSARLRGSGTAAMQVLYDLHSSVREPDGPGRPRAVARLAQLAGQVAGT